MTSLLMNFAALGVIVLVAAYGLLRSQRARLVTACVFKQPRSHSLIELSPGAPPRIAHALTAAPEPTPPTAPVSPSTPTPTPPASIALTPTFKLIFFSVLGLTILSLVASFVLVLLPNQTPAVKSLLDSVASTWKLGFGAIVGLIGGKAL